MTQEEVEATILEDAVGDYIGLWEINWIMNSLMPDASKRSKREVAEESLRALLLRGMVELFRGVSFLGDQVRVTTDDLDSALAAPHWQPSVAAREHIRVGATDAGRRAYYSRGKA